MPTNPKRTFDFQRDTFSFANETKWQYGIDPATGQQVSSPRVPSPRYTLRCYVVARSAKQFWQHARFDAQRPTPDDLTCRCLIRAVVSRAVDQVSTPEKSVIIPGYTCLREFSVAHEKALKEECGGAWQSYMQRGNWRMILPFTRRHQVFEATRLLGILNRQLLAIVHVSRFPQLTINHALLLFGASQNNGSIIFRTYDPNVPEQEIQMAFDRATRTFRLPPLHYFVGGAVDTYEIYRGWFF